MNAKPLVWIGLVLQLLFFFYFLIQAPEPCGSIKIGLEKLKASYPTEAAIIPETIHGAVPVSTSGDFFQMAGIGFKYLISITIAFVISNIILSVLLLLSL